MIVYKLVRKLKNGDIAPLFVNKKQRLKFDTWLQAESHPTKGFAVRPGWHCTVKPTAPHLSKRNRVWVKAEVNLADCYFFKRPKSQGGEWVLTKQIKIKGLHYIKRKD